MGALKLISITLLILTLSHQSLAQSFGAPKVNLDDIKIKGDANTDSSNFSNRSRHSLGDRIKLRTNFRKEVLENLPQFYKPVTTISLPQAPR